MWLASRTKPPSPRAVERNGWLRTAIALRPTAPASHIQLAGAFMGNRDLAGAEVYFRWAVALDQTNSRTHFYLGYLLWYRKTQLPEAEACFRRAIDLDPGYVMAHDHLGALLERKGNFGGPEACYRRAIELDPKYVYAHVGLVNLLLVHKGDRSGAEACCRRAIEVDPKYDVAHRMLGMLLADKGDLPGAEKCYRQCPRRNRTMPGFTNRWDWCLSGRVT